MKMAREWCLAVALGGRYSYSKSRDMLDDLRHRHAARRGSARYRRPQTAGWRARGDLRIKGSINPKGLINPYAATRSFRTLHHVSRPGRAARAPKAAAPGAPRRAGARGARDRAQRTVALVVLALSAAGCLGRAPAEVAARSTPVRITIIGDSLTEQYGPVFQEIAREHGAVVTGVWHGGTNPVDNPWSTWVREWSGVDFVVLQDSAILQQDVHHSLDEYLAAWQTLVDSARTVLRPGGQVIVMNGNHPDLSSIHGIDRLVDQVTPDSPDGIHWTEAGFTAEAALLFRQLSQTGT